MKNNYTFILLIALIANVANAQQAVTTAGGNASGSTGNVSYSVGQIDFIAHSNTTNAGIQQSFDNSISLPITGLLINAIKQGKDVLVKWETVTETNSSHFIVQRSTAINTTADSIGNIIAKGNSNVLSNYSWVDKSPAKGINYYRLKQVDKDGKYVYSATVAINFESGFIVSCYPNPTSSIIKLDIGSSNANGYSFQLFDLNGKLLQSSTITNTITTVNMESLKSATYIIKITNSQFETFSVTVFKR
jgi:hypothetical protein